MEFSINMNDLGTLRILGKLHVLDGQFAIHSYGFMINVGGMIIRH